eukprot:SAG31_NODE_30543_length_379_cov_1.214286_1_plen_44_part_01
MRSKWALRTIAELVQLSLEIYQWDTVQVPKCVERDGENFRAHVR